MEIADFLDRPKIDLPALESFFIQRGLKAEDFESRRIKGRKGETDFVRIRIPGRRGKLSRRRTPAPTLGIIGRLGGVGARPHRLGLVSDADGAIAALATALKLVEMRTRGDILEGDVIVATHLCPHSPVIPHEPVSFMGAPLSMAEMNRLEVDAAMDAILSIDTTKGNRVINRRGFAISPTVKDGYILRVSEDLLDIMQNVTGRLPVVFPIATQDITPYGNGVYHLNSIMQPATATHAPVVGVALTTEVAVPGCATGASHEVDMAMAVRFCVEVVKAFGAGDCAFYDEVEFRKLVALYGSMEHLKNPGRSRKRRKG